LTDSEDRVCSASFYFSGETNTVIYLEIKKLCFMLSNLLKKLSLKCKFCTAFYMFFLMELCKYLFEVLESIIVVVF
jgi:hypothetical protein